MNDPTTRGPQFATTRWSLVFAANPRDASQTNVRKALEALCQAYWFPLYAYVRNRGYSSSDAQDLTQSFFAGMIESGGFTAADPQKGRFRSYLIAALKHFLANEWHRANAKKRGGGVTILEWDGLNPEARYVVEPAQTVDLEAGFDREWAKEIVARSLGKLRANLEADGKGELFEALKGSLTGDEPSRSETAARLGMTESAVKVAVHRFRRHYRELLRSEIAETVADPSDVDDEMRHLVSVLRRK